MKNKQDLDFVFCKRINESISYNQNGYKNKLDIMGKAAKTASRQLAALTTTQKNAALLAIAAELERQAALIIAQNALDIAHGRDKGLSESLLDRMLLNKKRVTAIAENIHSIMALPDPVDTEIESRLLPNGIRLSRRRIPIGVLGVIYEARPDVTLHIAALSLKTGNAVILRGGSEILYSNLALVNVINVALKQVNFPLYAVQFIDSPERILVTELLHLDKYVDVIIPRGGPSLHQLCKEQSIIPVMTGGIGICHLYVDSSADLDKSVDIVENAKVHRPSACNALDTVLVNRTVAEQFLPKLAARLAKRGVELRTTAEVLEILQHKQHQAKVVPAGLEDFDQEWLALVLGVKVVDGLDEAIEHINQHGTEHSDGILTNDWHNANRFVNEITSSTVFINASTRFNDGGQFGLGGEVAISTQKLHARGPVGLEGLITYKWICQGNWHVRP